MNTTYLNGSGSSSTTTSSNSLMTARFVWMVAVFVITVIGNTILITVSFRRKSYRNITNFFNLNLAASDILKVVFFVPIYLVYCENETWPLGVLACRTYFPVFYMAFISSVLLLMCLSWERYNLVVKPLKTQMRHNTAKLLALICWLMSVVMAVPLAASLGLVRSADGSFHCWFVAQKKSGQAVILFIIVTLGAFPLAFFIVTYFKMIRELKSHGISPADESRSSVNRARRNRRAISILLTEVILFIACIVPFYFVSVKSLFVPFEKSLHPFSWESLMIFGMMITFSAINPVLHGFLNTEFRKEVKSLFSDVRCRVSSVQLQTEQKSTNIAFKSMRIIESQGQTP